MPKDLLLYTAPTAGKHVTSAIEFNLLSASFILNLEENTNFPIIAPSGARLVRFTFQTGTDVYVALNDLFIVPSPGTFANNAAELNPILRVLPEGAALNFLCPASTALVKVDFYTA